MIGGTVGSKDNECLTIDFLWIDDLYRGKGYGSSLLRYIEKVGRYNGCKVAFLNTFSFQEPDFYPKKEL
ncbi:GNAT family N-acetyltransferase [Tissierella sp. MSJ-40]|uniref:GNAT family N-acetyltransferase n=1 Tax=Tissierella simiarum TaxID=2841534 RepID=A0ABS6E7F1_9FIRM|nr:GNAT family N-acetyltransferase [Tissierella simiarum]